MTEETLVERFEELSENSLSESDLDKLLELLAERRPYAADLINHRIKIDAEYARKSLEREQEIQRKLKAQRIKVLRELDELAKNRSVSRHYSAKFALPPMPMFLNKIG